MNHQQLAAAERRLLAEEILSQLRHTVCNKMGSARNAAFFIRRSIEKSGVATDSRLPAFFQLIDDELSAAGNHLASQFGGGDDSSWPRSGTQLRECIDSALALRPSAPGISVSVQCSPELTLSVRTMDFIVALRGLIDNACEAVEPGGEISIIASADSDCLTIAVRDTGGGFSPESAERAFAAFYTTKPGHLGLGLNLVQRLLKDYGGRVVIQPAPRGACVSVQLPLQETP